MHQVCMQWFVNLLINFIEIVWAGHFQSCFKGNKHQKTTSRDDSPIIRLNKKAVIPKHEFIVKINIKDSTCAGNCFDLPFDLIARQEVFLTNQWRGPYRSYASQYVRTQSRETGSEVILLLTGTLYFESIDVSQLSCTYKLVGKCN